MNLENLDQLIEDCLSQLIAVKNGEFNTDKADRVAAMFLEAQMRLSTFIEDIDFKAKVSKSEIDRVSANKYFEHKEKSAEKSGKTTEAALKYEIDRDMSVVDIKKENAKFEAEVKKYNSILNSLKDGHVYFRTMNKTNNKTSWD